MDKIKELEKQIEDAANAYYNGAEIISDDEYDSLVYELSCLDPKNSLLSKIGAEPTKDWKKEKHLYPLGSLSKVNFPHEMTKWINESLGDKEVVVSDKLDGLSIGCQYDNGVLTKAILRGNGLEAENILENVVKMQGVVKQIPNFTGVLRGEIILSKSNHKAFFPDKANPRNAASGICRRLDGVGSEHLQIRFYQVYGKDFPTEFEQFQFIEQCGCLTPRYVLCKTAQEVNNLWHEYQSTVRQSLDYEIDGLVISCNDSHFQKSLGEVALKPKGKLAFKFANQFIKTTVTDIKWEIGNSGRVTPVCWFTPVNLLGSRVEKASIYNIAYINKLGLDIGAEVLVCKANEIIPRVERVVKSVNSVTKPPTSCPECGYPLIMEGENLVCTNISSCPGQVAGRIKNWVNELNLLEWGESLVERLVNSGKVKTLADLYTLGADDLATVDRMGKKSAKKCYDILWNNAEVALDIFLGGLSIPMIGSSTIRLIMNSGCDTLEKFGQLKAEHFEMVTGVGPVKAKSLENGLRNNQQLILDLLKNGIKIKTKQKVVGKLSNLKFAFTGTMAHGRKELEKMVQDFGGEIGSGKNLNYLVINDINSISSKTIAAKKNGTQLITEDQFLKMVE